MGIKSKQSFCRFQTNIEHSSPAHIFCWDCFLHKKGDFLWKSPHKKYFFHKRKKNYNIGFGVSLVKRKHNKRPLVYFHLQNPIFWSSLRLTRKIKYVFPCCLFFFVNNAGIWTNKSIVVSNKYRRVLVRSLLFFWRLLFFSFFLQILWTQKQISYCIIRLEETLSRDKNRNTHYCTVLSREKYLLFCSQKSKAKRNIFV